MRSCAVRTRRCPRGCAVGAMFLTPLNVTFWGSLDPAMNTLLRSFSLDPLHMLIEVSMLLGLPLAAGMFIAHRFPALARRAQTPNPKPQPPTPKPQALPTTRLLSAFAHTSLTA